MHHVAARRQHEDRRRGALLAQQAEDAARIRLVGIDAPVQPAGDVRRIAAEPRVHHQGDLPGRHHRHGRSRGRRGAARRRSGRQRDRLRGRRTSLQRARMAPAAPARRTSRPAASGSGWPDRCRADAAPSRNRAASSAPRRATPAGRSATSKRRQSLAAARRGGGSRAIMTSGLPPEIGRIQAVEAVVCHAFRRHGTRITTSRICTKSHARSPRPAENPPVGEADRAERPGARVRPSSTRC